MNIPPTDIVENDIVDEEDFCPFRWMYCCAVMQISALKSFIEDSIFLSQTDETTFPVKLDKKFDSLQKTLDELYLAGKDHHTKTRGPGNIC